MARSTSEPLLKCDVKAIELVIKLKAAPQCHVALWGLTELVADIAKTTPGP